MTKYYDPDPPAKIAPAQDREGYTPKEAAHLLGASMTGKKLRRMIRKGLVEGANKSTGRWYISAKTVQSMVEEHKKVLSAAS